LKERNNLIFIYIVGNVVVYPSKLQERGYEMDVRSLKYGKAVKNAGEKGGETPGKIRNLYYGKLPGRMSFETLALNSCRRFPGIHVVAKLLNFGSLLSRALVVDSLEILFRRTMHRSSASETRSDLHSIICVRNDTASTTGQRAHLPTNLMLHYHHAASPGPFPIVVPSPLSE
jgi:hypothetical protein